MVRCSRRIFAQLFQKLTDKCDTLQAETLLRILPVQFHSWRSPTLGTVVVPVGPARKVCVCLVPRERAQQRTAKQIEDAPQFE